MDINQILENASQPQTNGSLSGWIGTINNNLSGATQKMRWEEQMRATQYQAAVNDMQKAGLNPAMMYQSGGNGAGLPSAPNGNQYNAKIPELLGATASIINSVTNARKVDVMSNQNEMNGRTATRLYNTTANIARMLAKFMA